MGGESCNLVAETFGRNNRNFITNSFVCLEVESEPRVVFFNQNTRAFLDGLGPNASLRRMGLIMVIIQGE